MLEQLAWGLFIVGGVGLFLTGVFIVFTSGATLLSFVYVFFSALLKQGVKVTFRKITEKPIYALAGFGALWGFMVGLSFALGLAVACVNFLLD